MKKMVNRLQLKRQIVRRFVNDSDDDEVNSDIEVIETNDPKNTTFDEPLKISSTKVDNNKSFTNYKVCVRKSGETVHRYVATDVTDYKPFVINETLDQLIACNDINQMANVFKNREQLNKLPNGSNEGLNPKAKSFVPNSSDNTSNNFESKDLLQSEGIRQLSKLKSKQSVFKCEVCDIRLEGIQLALDHSKSDRHLKKKFGDDLKGMDALFTIDSEEIGDVQIAISRRKELKKIVVNDKQKYLDHGIRLKDGSGPNAYICSKCNLSFHSLKEVEKHFKSIEIIDSKPKSDDKKDDNSTNCVELNKVDLKLKNEGIKDTKSTDDSKYYCIFCNIYFDCKRLAVYHTNDTRHKKQKSGENLNEIDAKFTIPSNRIDELEVLFARKSTLKAIPPKTKSEFIDHSIRLRDGIGLNAFFCLKCELSMESIEDIDEHIRSLIHSM